MKSAARHGVSSREVAKLAGVSQSTVSRIINGRSNVTPKTRRRVERAMAELGYVPNAAARTLITGRSRLIGLVVANITNGFHPEVIEAVSLATRAAGYTLLITIPDLAPEAQVEDLRILAEHRADGVIMMSLPLEGMPIVGPYLGNGLPIVMVNLTSDDVDADYVSVDGVKAGRIPTEHLIWHSRQRIAYVGGRSTASSERDHEIGYRQALAGAAIRLDPDLVTHGEYTYESGYARTQELIASGRAFDAIVAGDDMIALGCMDALSEAGLQVPGDVAIIGSDNILAARLNPVGLTTMNDHLSTLGRLAVETLVRRIDAGPTSERIRVLIAPDLIARRSCGCNHGSDSAA